MGFGGFMIGLVGYGTGVYALVNALAALSDVLVAKRHGKSEDGLDADQNTWVVIKSVAVSFGCFVVTWLILKI